MALAALLQAALAVASAGAPAPDPDALRFVLPPRATLEGASSPESGRRMLVHVEFRTNRPIGPGPRGNARAEAYVDGNNAEWVSRVGPKRRNCYAAASVGSRLRTAHIGQVVRFELHARGQVLRTDLRVTRGPVRPLGCAGREER
jgi:hypothetical protein